MVRYKICRLLEHRSVGLSQTRCAAPLLRSVVENTSVSYIFINGYELAGVLQIIRFSRTPDRVFLVTSGDAIDE